MSEGSANSTAPLPYITLHSRHSSPDELRPEPVSAATTPQTQAQAQAPTGSRDSHHTYGHNTWHHNHHSHYNHYNYHGFPGGGVGYGHPYMPQAATHDISRASYHVKNIGRFAETLEESVKRAFPNRGQPSRRYNKVFAILVHWQIDDLFVMPELNDLERCLRNDYFFGTEVFAIPPTNSHLELMLRVAQLIKDHEASDTLFILYYGGHAKIDDARQSTWVATRQPNAPWLQWSAVQTLLERSASDVLILLDCCSGAASAAFPAGCTSITETISASSWNAIAPEPGRYSFTNILIEVLQEWRERTFSAAMLHAEMLARLKHPRPVVINGQICESRATPVHFMMTANHRAPSIEITRLVPQDWVVPPPAFPTLSPAPSSARGAGGSHQGQEPAMAPGGRGGVDVPVVGPDEDTPHVMISLALEDNQDLNIEAWEQWLAAFPALARNVKVQGVFKSHSTLLLLSMPVMVWDMLPDDYSTNFVAFIRSGNLAAEPPAKPNRASQAVSQQKNPGPIGRRRGPVRPPPDDMSFKSESTTLVGTEDGSIMRRNLGGIAQSVEGRVPLRPLQGMGAIPPPPTSSSVNKTRLAGSLHGLQREASQGSEASITKRPIINQVLRSAQWSTLDPSRDLPECPQFAVHVEARLETYYQQIRWPNNNQREFIASNLGIEPFEIEVWFLYREEKENEAAAAGDDSSGAMMITGPQLGRLLDILPSEQVLIVDVRPSKHTRHVISNSVHVRMPLGFIETAAMDLIGQAFRYSEDMDGFATWKTANCIVFHSDDVRFTWECPTADGLLCRFREQGWSGQCFVLSGRLRDFREMFPQHISRHVRKTRVDGTTREDSQKRVGLSGSADAASQDNSTSSDARPCGVGTTGPTEQAEQPGEVEGYQQWLEELYRDGNGGQQGQALTPTAMADRVKLRDQRERELADEFIEAFPVLYKASHQYEMHAPGGIGSSRTDKDRGKCKGKGKGKGKAKADDDDNNRFALEAQMVPYLESGLGRLRKGLLPSTSTSTSTSPPVADIPAKKMPVDDDDGRAHSEVLSAPHSPSDEYVKVGDGDSSNGSSGRDSGSLHQVEKKKVVGSEGASSLRRGWKKLKGFGRS